MPNENNVEALAVILLDIHEHEPFAATPDNLPPEYARDLARQLASRGVLVPSALTGENVLRDIRILELHAADDPEEAVVTMRADLERIAKGESI